MCKHCHQRLLNEISHTYHKDLITPQKTSAHFNSVKKVKCEVYEQHSTKDLDTNMTTITLTTLDYVILAIVLIISLGIGIYFACFGEKQNTTKQYFKGGSNMNIIPVIMSMLASSINSNSMLGIPAEVYHFGFNYWFVTLGALIGGPIAIYGFVPVFYKLHITSICEYSQQRFNTIVKKCNSFMFISSLVVFASFSAYTPALALSQATGLSVWGSILTTTTVTTIYTSIGGIKAVIWIDAFQLIIFTIALLAIIIKGCIDVGGVSYILNKSIEGERLSTLSFSPDPRIRYTFWGILIYSTIQYMFFYGTAQMHLQRYMCCSTLKKAQRSIWTNLIGFVPISTIYCFIGLSLYAMYWNCDPLSSRQIDRPDQLLPLFVMNSMSSIPGMPGLFVAGVYSAALSTSSSVLNSLAAMTLVDHVKPRWKKLSDKKATLIAKFIAAGYGVVCLLVIVAIINLGSIVQAWQYLTGSSVGANLGLFFLGLMNPWANAKGSIIGFICGLSVSWWISIGSQIYRPISQSLLLVSTVNCTDILGEWTPRLRPLRNEEHIFELYKISYLWLMPIAFVITVVVGSVSSLVIGSNKNLDMNLISPFVHSVMKKFFSKKYEELQRQNKEVSQLEVNSVLELKNLNEINRFIKPNSEINI